MMIFTLRDHGDAVEHDAACRYDLDLQFPNYEKFWQLHVVPATQRPDYPGNFNDGADSAIISLAQTSHSLFRYLFNAREDLECLQRRDFGSHYRKWTDFIKYAGDALQLQKAITDLIEGELSLALRQKIRVFPDWPTAWEPSYYEVAKFRNYSTHKGYMQIFSADGEPFIAARTELSKGNFDSVTWTISLSDFHGNRNRFSPLVDVADSIFVDTIEWLNRAYGRVIDVMSPLLSRADYQQLWGRRHDPIATHSVLPPPIFTSGHNVVPQIKMCGTTAPTPRPIEIKTL